VNGASLRVVKHAAAGPYLGFSLQQVRLCYYLLCVPADASVSIEYMDDVAVHYADGRVLLEQCKSALSSSNPISDWSEDLWKTTANWLDAVEAKQVDGAKSSFHIYVTPRKRFGKFSVAMHAAADSAAVQALVEQVKDKLDAKSDTPKCTEHLQRFLDASAGLRNMVVNRTTIASDDDDPLEPLRDLLRPTVPEASLEVICTSAIGQAKEAADKFLRRKEPAVVSVAEFRKNFHAFVRQNNLAGYLPTFTDAPPQDVTKALLTNRPVFVRQLQLIEATVEQQLRAASDLMRTSGDKAKWADQGLVFDGTFKDWEDSLLRLHAGIQGEIADTMADKTKVVQGRTVYNRCSQMTMPLDSRAVPTYFTHGGFNDLADRRLLGWHSDHESLLGKDDEQ